MKKIEKLIDRKTDLLLSKPGLLGRVKRLETGTDTYINILKKFPKKFNLQNMRIVIDCANGAGYKAAPKLIKSLGAEVIIIGNNPSGLNINENVAQLFLRKYKQQ